MIAVSQNLALGVPIVTGGAGAIAPENTQVAENEFLLMFDQLAPIADMATAQDRKIETELGGADDTSDKSVVEISCEPEGSGIAFLPPFALIIRATQLPKSELTASTPLPQPSTKPMLPERATDVFGDGTGLSVKGVPQNSSLWEAVTITPVDMGVVLPIGLATDRPVAQLGEQPAAAIVSGSILLDGAASRHRSAAITSQKEMVPTAVVGNTPSAEPIKKGAVVGSSGAGPSFADAPIEIHPSLQSKPPEDSHSAVKGSWSTAETVVAVTVRTLPTSSAETALRQKWVEENPLPRSETDPAPKEPFAALPKVLLSPTAATASQAITGLGDSATPTWRQPSDGTPKDQAGQLLSLDDQSSPFSAIESTSDQPTTEAVHSQKTYHRSVDSFSSDVPLIVSDSVTNTRAVPTVASTAVAPSHNSATHGLPVVIAPAIIDMSKSRNDGPLELALSPEELGGLTISIKQDGDFVHVAIAADRPETLDLMRRHAGDLVADLRQAGFSGASLSFGQGGQGAPPRFAQPQPATKDQPSPQHRPPETKRTAPSRSLKGSGMDLRL